MKLQASWQIPAAEISPTMIRSIIISLIKQCLPIWISFQLLHTS